MFKKLTSILCALALWLALAPFVGQEPPEADRPSTEIELTQDTEPAGQDGDAFTTASIAPDLPGQSGEGGQ